MPDAAATRHAGSVAASTLLLVVALALMGRAATLGGDIRHPEITAARVAGTAAPAGDPERFVASQISHFMVDSLWGWPASETIHFLGLSLSFGVLLAVNLRILGVMKQVPFAEIHRLLPWGMLGFGANLITGMLFFVGQPKQYIGSTPFYWKIIFLMIAGANFLYLTVFRQAWNAGDREQRTGTRAASTRPWRSCPCSRGSWSCTAISMLPFIGHAF